MIVFLIPSKSLAHGPRFFQIIEKSDWKTIKEFIKNGADPNAQDSHGISLLEKAIINHRTDVFNLLIEKGADVNATYKEGSTALMTAAESGNTDATAKLINKRANIHAVNADGWNAFMISIYYDKADVMEQLIQAGATFNRTLNEYDWGDIILAGLAPLENPLPENNLRPNG